MERFGRVKASPLARRIASELGVDLASSKRHADPAGRIVKRDVEDASSAGDAVGGTPPEEALATGRGGGSPAAAGPAAGAPGPSSASPETAKGTVEIVELTKLQQVVARRMSESKATAPHFYLTAEVDMSAAVAARARIKEISAEGEVVPSFNDMVVKACAIALRRFPRANGSYKDGRFELYSRINVGIAVAAQDALVVPTIFDADKKGLREIAADARALAGESPRRRDHPAGALGRHLLGVEPGDVRDQSASRRSSTHRRRGSSRSVRSPTGRWSRTARSSPAR